MAPAYTIQSTFHKSILASQSMKSLCAPCYIGENAEAKGGVEIALRLLTNEVEIGAIQAQPRGYKVSVLHPFTSLLLGNTEAMDKRFPLKPI
jgi:hypothetical protein